MAGTNAEKAVLLDEGLAEAHASLGSYLASQWRFSASEREFRRAIELRPSYSPAYHWFALMLGQTGRSEESLQMELRALDIDPLSMTSGLGAAVASYMMGKYTEADSRLKELAKAYPDYVGIPFWHASVYAALENKDDAIREAERAIAVARSPTTLLNLAGTLSYFGSRDEASKALEEARKSGYIGPGYLGYIEVYLGRTEEGYAHIEEGVKTKDTGVILGRFDPINLRFMKGPRWEEIVKTIDRAIKSG